VTLALSAMLSTSDKRCRKFGERNDFEMTPLVKMETRNPVEGYFGIEFQRSVITEKLWQPEVARR